MKIKSGFVLEKVGGEPMKGIRNIADARNQTMITEAIKEICDATLKMSEDKTGALIVIERSTKLGEHIKTDVFMLRAVFFPFRSVPI